MLSSGKILSAAGILLLEWRKKGKTVKGRQVARAGDSGTGDRRLDTHSEQSFLLNTNMKYLQLISIKMIQIVTFRT